jgi:oxidase EvaA
LLDRVRQADRFVESALTADSPIMPLSRFHPWLEEQRARCSLQVRRVPFAALDEWGFSAPDQTLTHRSGRFFTVEGLAVATDFGPVPAWEQPIIRQPEIGILGIIARDFGGIRHFLMQAKIEPGNVNGVQLSPTVQSTRSNYTRVHGGRPTLYGGYFTEPGRARILIDRLLFEQGARFLRKQNRNVIVEVDEDIALEPGFCWLTLGQIKRLLRHDNMVNMSARSVLSCIPLAGKDPQAVARDPRVGEFGAQIAGSLAPDLALHSDTEVLNWLNRLRARYVMQLSRRPLDQLRGWTFEADRISHESGRHFSVVAVEVEATDREVSRWGQPLLAHSGHGLNGLLLQRIGGVLHVLVRACAFPGNGTLFELGSTVSRANAKLQFGAAHAPPFLEYFQDPPSACIRYEARHSEEGGRFMHFVSVYMLVELPPDVRLHLPENYCFMTLAQLSTLNAYGCVNIEGRNLLSCISLID